MWTTSHPEATCLRTKRINGGRQLGRPLRCKCSTRESPPCPRPALLRRHCRAYPRVMAEVVFFHHSGGLTAGVNDFADTLRAAGHTVHTPDLFEGRTFADVSD